MWVSEIRLADFRSYAQVTVALEPGATCFVGANGQGKTNLVEAVAYASVLGSHRVATDAPLVRAGAERAVIGIGFHRDGRAMTLELELNPGRANRARLNGSPVARPRELVGLVSTVVFAPEDLSLVKGDPSERRRWLDDLLVQRTPRLAAARADVDRIVRQRNALLRTGQVDPAALDVWDEQLVRAAAELGSARVRLLGDLSPHVEQAYAAIAGDGPRGMSLAYRASTTTDPGDTDTSWSVALSDTLERRRHEELARGVTLVGTHRDDVDVALGDHPAKGYASHGESWSAALALRLAAWDLLRADGEQPVLILDDVFAELDDSRRALLAGRVADAEQVLITAAVAADVPTDLTARRMSVRSGEVGDG